MVRRIKPNKNCKRRRKGVARESPWLIGKSEQRSKCAINFLTDRRIDIDVRLRQDPCSVQLSFIGRTVDCPLRASQRT
jgi:hypothetical protein